MRKLLTILIPSFILALIFFLGFQTLVVSRSQKGALQVTTSPESDVYLNNVLIGKTPLCKCEADDMLLSGNYTLKLVPSDSNFSEFQEKVVISDGVLTVVDRRFSEGSKSTGSIISLSKLPDDKESELVIVSLPQGAEVELDSNGIGKTPLVYKDPTESDHVLKLSKEGYREKDNIRIHTPIGYKLTVLVYLATGSDLEVSNPVATPTPDVSEKVIILQTPTGFLRVRSSFALSGTEIGRVNPDQEYDLVDEQNGWFKIRLDDEVEGWISSEYARKIIR